MKKRLFSLVLALTLFVSLFLNVKADVQFLYGNVVEKMINSSGFSQEFMLKIADTNGDETVYNCASRVLVNGTSYRLNDSLFNAIPDNVFVKMAVEDNLIKVLNFDTETKTYNKVSYHPKRKTFDVLNSKEANLPVYYTYNGNFVPYYADENHLYDIEVSKYAVHITGVSSKTGKGIIGYIRTSAEIDRNFNQYVCLECETGIPGDNILKGEIYDANSNLVFSSESECSDFGELELHQLENADKTYTIKLWLEDRDKNVLSNVYKLEYSTKKIDVKYVYIEETDISDGINQLLMIKTVDPDGTQKVYNCESYALINGRRYRDVYDQTSAVNTGVFAKIAVSDGTVKALNFGTDFTPYENVSYDANTKTFEGLNDETSTLPVYYTYFEDFVPAYLDANHNYNLEVYDYAVLVTDVGSKNYNSVVKKVVIGSDIDRHFAQCIDLECKSFVDGADLIKAQLFDENSNLVGSVEETLSEPMYLEFNGLENADRTYTIKLWLESMDDSNVASEVYTFKHSTKKIDVKYAHVLRKGFSNGLDEVVMIKIVEPDGTSATYNCDSNLFINGRRYRNPDEQLNAVSENVFAKIALSDGVVKVINFTTEPQLLENVSYDENEKCFEGISKDLPIYYSYNETFTSAHLDANHLYDIELHEYGAYITDMKSKTDKEVIKLIQADNGIGKDFSPFISVYCEADLNGEYLLKSELYTEKMKPLDKSEGRYYNNFGELVFDKLKNKTDEYIIKLWLEDNNKNVVSNVYTINKQLKQNEITYGDISVKYTHESDDGEQKILLNVKDIGGNDRTFVCDENVQIINQASFFAMTRATAEIPEDAFVKMALEGDVVKAIKIGLDELEVSSADFEYTDGNLVGKVYFINNGEAPLEFDCVLGVYDSQNKMKNVQSLPVEVEMDDYIFAEPSFENYQYTDGDYVKILSFSDLNSISPLIAPVESWISSK